MSIFVAAPIVDDMTLSESFTGRTPLTTSETVITKENVRDLVDRARAKHRSDVVEMEYLWRYYHGVQPILLREKLIRPEINNKIVENHAQEIVTFFNGYFLGDPIVYSRFGSGADTDNVEELNKRMRGHNKEAADLELAEWLFVCGRGYRIALPGTSSDDFIIDTLDPRRAFVLRSTAIGRPVLCGVQLVRKDDGTELVCGYTKEAYFEYDPGKDGLRWQPHTMGRVPIIEYTANHIQMGAFEPVLTLLDAINLATSNRLDGVEQFIQNLMVLYNADIDGAMLKQIQAYGLIKLMSPQGVQADVKFIQQQFDQADAQILIDAMLQTVKDIIGMPNRIKGTGGGTSGNVGSVIMWQGWELCAARTQIIEGYFKASEREFLSLVLSFMKTKKILDIDSNDLDIKFTRRQYDASITKVQILQGLLAAGVDKVTACTVSGLFSDPVSTATKMEDQDEPITEPSPGDSDGDLESNQ